MIRQFYFFLFIFIAGCSSSGRSDAEAGAIITLTKTITSSPTLTITPSPSSTLTYTVAPSLTPSPSPSITLTPVHPLGELIFHEANEEIVYSWFSYVPHGLDKDQINYILITGVHGGSTFGDYDAMTEESRRIAESTPRNGGSYQDFVLLMPVIPRSATPHIYSVAFDLHSFSDWVDPFYQRADLKVNLMIDQLLYTLRVDGYNMADKVFIEGFSAGGMFAQRYALLHPDRVQAIAAGHCGGNFTLPEETYNGEPLNWPVGINNYESLVGYEFDRSEYKKIPQFIYIGGLDTENSIVWPYEWGPQSMWESTSQLYFLNEVFGNSDPIRLENEITFLNELGYDNIIFEIDPQISHYKSGDMFYKYHKFLRENK